jgi:molecular chaperone GrpE
VDDTAQDLAQKCEEYLAGWKRALADYDNLKKDLVREKGEMRRAVSAETILSLIPVMDNFDQAMKFKPKCEDSAVDQWLVGVMQVRNQLEEAMRSFGAEPFGRESDAFDPALHESAGSRKHEGKPDGSVLEVVQRGWKLGDRIVRPAKVVINSL